MASSSEAFEKLETWRKSKTALKVTVIVGGQTTDVLVARIAAIDPDASLVGLAFEATRTYGRLAVEDAEFSIEPSRLVVTRSESDWLIFEEDV